MELNLKGKPFYLEEDQVAWVNETYESMSLEEKAGQLICGGVPVISDELIDEVTKEHKLGGMLLRPFPVAGLKERVVKVAKCKQDPHVHHWQSGIWRLWGFERGNVFCTAYGMCGSQGQGGGLPAGKNILPGSGGNWCELGVCTSGRFGSGLP
mgnify:CR=1 FL=1